MNIKEEDVLNVFRMYIGIKLHFNEPSFIYKDGFRSKLITSKSMDKRNDIDFFIKVAERYHNDMYTLKQLMISHFKNNSDTYIRDIIEMKTDSAFHVKRLGHIQGIDNLIQKDTNRLFDYIEINNLSIDDMIHNQNKDRPLIIKKLRLSDEFLAVLDYHFSYLSQDTINPLWNKRKEILRKYKYMIDNYPSDFLLRKLFD